MRPLHLCAAISLGWPGAQATFANRGAKGDSQGLGLLLGEHPQAEVAILEGFEGGWHHQVFPRGQPSTARHLPQVDIGAGASRGLVTQEEVPAQVHVCVTLQL